MKDKIYTDSEVCHPDLTDEGEDLKKFAFNSKVASVFDDMVSRSVPGYEEVQQLTVDFASKILNFKSQIYDLGCSTGTTLIRLANNFRSLNFPNIKNKHKTAKFYGIDSSEFMIGKCQEKIDALSLNDLIELSHDSLENFNISDADLVISHYTLQFLEPSKRQNILEKIHSGLCKDGYLIISEKIKYSDLTVHNFMTDKYYEYKKSMGYTEIEIARKREALENVLIPLTVDGNLELLRSSGFSEISIVKSSLLFTTFLARKN